MFGIFQFWQVKDLKKEFNKHIYTNRELGKMFNINYSTVGYIVKGKAWKHIID